MTGVGPDHGPQAGSTGVTLSGTDFVSGAAVTFGGTAASAVNFVSPAELGCLTPSGTGTVDVVVANPDGQSGTLPGGYTYDAPRSAPDGGCVPGPAASFGAVAIAFAAALGARRRFRPGR